MPKRVEEAKIALINSPLEIEKTELSAEIRIIRPDPDEVLPGRGDEMLKGMVDKVKEAGANVVFCQKGIDDIAQHYLAKAGIMAVRRVKESDMTQLAKATGGRVVTNLDDLTPTTWDTPRWWRRGRSKRTSGSSSRAARTRRRSRILLRGGPSASWTRREGPPRRHNGGQGRHREARHRRVEEAPLKLRSPIACREWAQHALRKGAAGGAEVRRRFRSHPADPGENAGMDPIDTQVDLRAAHAKNKTWAGIDVIRRQGRRHGEGAGLRACRRQVPDHKVGDRGRRNDHEDRRRDRFEGNGRRGRRPAPGGM